MTKTLLLTVALTLCGSRLAASHPGGHDDEHHHAPKKAAIDEKAAKARAQQELERLVKVKKVGDSWKTAARFHEAKKQGEGDKWEWLVTFDNDQVKEKDKQRLFIFLKPSGEFVAANFTGK
jgi:hypothetical protein